LSVDLNKAKPKPGNKIISGRSEVVRKAKAQRWARRQPSSVMVASPRLSRVAAVSHR
jgi:hypothetical protein